MTTPNANSSRWNLPAPQDSDLIRDGDDAITELGNKVADLLASVIPTVLDDGIDLDTLQTTATWIVYGTRTHANRPSTAFGLLVVTRIGSTSTIQRWTSGGTDPASWIRWRGSTGWIPWRRDDAPAAILAVRQLIGDRPPVSAAGVRRVPLALTLGGGSATYTASTGGVRMPVRYSAPISRWRVHIRHHNPRYATIYPATIQLSGVWLTGHDGNGNPIGSTVRISSATSIADGSEWVSRWMDIPLAPGSDHLICYGWTAPSATQSVIGGGWRTTAVDDAINASATTARRSTLPLDVWIEAETPATTPVVAVVGDSLSCGVGAVLPIYNSPLSIWARDHGVLPMHLAASGTSASSWADPNSHLWRWTDLDRPDVTWLALGSNDVFALDNSQPQIRADWLAAADAARLHYGPNLVASTILPRTSVTGAQETTRRAINTWIRTRPGGIRTTLDIVSAVSPDDETLTPGMDADGVHLSRTGYTALAAALPPLTPPNPTRDTGLIILGNEFGSNVAAGADGTISRIGDRVTLQITRLVPIASAATDNDLLTLPVGFRPARQFFVFLDSLTTRVSAALQTSGNLQAFATVADTYYRTSSPITYITNDPFPGLL